MNNKISIELNSQPDADDTINQSFSSIVIKQNINENHHFEIKLNADVIETDNVLFQKSRDSIGKQIKIHLDNYVFVGIVTKISIAKTNSSFKGNLVISGYSPTYILDDKPNTQSFLNCSLKDIVSKVKNAYPGNLINFSDDKIAPQYKTKLEYITQYNESGFQFINRLAADFGEWLYYDGTNTFFGLPSEQQTVTLYVGSDLQNLNISLQAQHVNYKMQMYDYMKNETVNKSSNDVSKPAMDSLSEYGFNTSKKLSGFTPQYINSGIYNLETPLSQVATDIVNIDTGTDASELVVLNAVSARLDLKIGTIIQVREKSGKNNNEENLGDYRIVSITHTSSGQGNYQNSFKAIPKALKYPPKTASTKPFCSAQPAIVTDNNDSLGRVRVQFYWQKEKNQKTPWIRILSSHAGNGRGFYFMPEVGDEVLVCFIDNDPDQPYIAGSLYHGKAKPSGVQDKNTSKGIVTIGGNSIVFSDENDKEKISIYNKKNKLILDCSDDGSVTVSTDGKIEIKASKSIEISADEDMTLKSGGDLNITAQKEIKIAASTGASFKSDTDMKIEGVQTAVKGSTKMDLDGGAMTTITGGIVKIN